MPHFVKCNAPGVFNSINSRIFNNQNIPPLDQGDQNQTCPRDIAMQFCGNSSTNIQDVSLFNVKIFPWVKDTKTLSLFGLFQLTYASFVIMHPMVQEIF